MIISKFIPRKIAALLRSRDQMVSYRKKMEQIRGEPSKYVYLFGTPNHANMGDHLIAHAERVFLEEEYQFNVMDIPTEMYHIYRTELRTIIPQSTPVFITGGGWMGDVWPIEERTLENMAYDFRFNPVLIFPQTIYYSRPSDDNSVARHAKKIFEKCENLTITVRDAKSFEYAKTHYSNNVVLCPDIALYSKEKPCCQKDLSQTIGICFREDREKVNHASADEIVYEFQKQRVKTKRLSTINSTPVSCDYRDIEVAALIREFSKCDLIFTDRLHGMIYSYIAGVPCIAFDNKTKKVSGVYDLWLSQSDYVKIVAQECEIDCIVKMGQQMLSLGRNSDREYVSFKKINEVINSWQQLNG